MKKTSFMNSVQTEINSWPSKFRKLTFVQKVVFLIVACYIFLTVKENTKSWDDLFEMDTWKKSVSTLFTIKHGVILTVVYFLFFGRISNNETKDEKDEKNS